MSLVKHKQILKKIVIYLLNILLISCCLIISNNQKALAEENKKELMLYKVKKHDILSVILYNYKLKPIYGKSGTLQKTLALNPGKKRTGGNLIYPEEIIVLPLLVDAKTNEELRQELSEMDVEPIEPSSHFIGDLGDKKEKPIIKKSKMKNLSQSDFTIKTDPKSVQLKWTENPPEIEPTYDLKRRIEEDEQFEYLKKKLKTNYYKDNKVTPGEFYEYSLTSKDNKDNSIESEVIEAATPPTSPTELEAKLEGKRIVLKWEKSESNRPITYIIKRYSESNPGFQVIADDVEDTEYRDSELIQEEVYHYVVAAKTEKSQSKDSNEVSIKSYEPLQIPSSIKASLSTRFMRLSIFDKATKTYSGIYTTASPGFEVYQVHDWSDHLKTYMGFNYVRAQFLQPPIYKVDHKIINLYDLIYGVKYRGKYGIYTNDELHIGKEISYQRVGYNSLTERDDYRFKSRILIGYEFFKKDNLHAFSELSYLANIPFNFNTGFLGHGFELGAGVRQNFEEFELGAYYFHSRNQFKTLRLESTRIENGLKIEFTYSLGKL